MSPERALLRRRQRRNLEDSGVTKPAPRQASDPLTYLVGVTTLVVYVVHGFNGSLTRDLAIYSYAGQQVVEGSPPYIGILNRAGPLAHLLPAIGVAERRAGGFDDLSRHEIAFYGFRGR